MSASALPLWWINGPALKNRSAYQLQHGWPARHPALTALVAQDFALSRRPAAGHRHGAGGFDELLTDSLRIDTAGFIAYIESQKPGYLQLES